MFFTTVSLAAVAPARSSACNATSPSFIATRIAAFALAVESVSETVVPKLPALLSPVA